MEGNKSDACCTCLVCQDILFADRCNDTWLHCECLTLIHQRPVAVDNLCHWFFYSESTAKIPENRIMSARGSQIKGHCRYVSLGLSLSLLSSPRGTVGCTSFVYGYFMCNKPPTSGTYLNSPIIYSSPIPNGVAYQKDTEWHLTGLNWDNNTCSITIIGALARNINLSVSRHHIVPEDQLVDLDFTSRGRE